MHLTAIARRASSSMSHPVNSTYMIRHGETDIKSLYIFRHGETDWNKRGIIQGRSNIP